MYAHTYIGLSKFISSLRISMAIRFFAVKIRDPRLRAVTSVLLLILHHVIAYAFSMVSNTALFISLYKLFSKSFFAHVLNYVLSSM